MTDSGVLERRLRPIHDAVSAGNYRQALKECEKWQKKGEKSDKFLALKAYVLVHQQDLNQVEKGETETIDLCHRSPPVTDLDAIQTIQGALEELSLEDEGEALFERAAAAKPGDRALLMTWLNDCLADARWQSAQKATMALRKAFPNDREYDFWNMLLCFLVHKDPAVEEKQRAMFGTLAYRMINKAAPNTAADQTANANKIVSTPEELALLAQIYIATGHAAEATTLLSELLDTETTNAGSQDPQLVLSLFIDAITASADWDQAVKQCEKMLQTSEHQNDDRIWTLVLQAHAKGEDAIKQKAGDLLKKFTTDEKLRNRSSLLARLKSLSSSGSQDDDTEIEKLCRMYYSSHKGRSFAFQDLRSSLEGLEQDKRRQFLKHIAEENGPDTPTANQIFSQKVERLAPTSSTGESLQNAANSLSIYQQSTRKGARSPEAVLLAAFSMLEAASQSNSSQLLLRATALVQLSYGKDEAHFPSAILLISIFRQLGLLSLAIATFVSLSVKNLQFETVAHHLLTRISTLHPHRPATSHADADTEEPETIMEPANAVDTALAVNDKVADGLAESIRRGFREGSYSNILDSVDTRTSIQTSIGRRIFQIEDRKLARLTGADATTHNGAYGLGQPPPQPSDMRDFAFLPSYSKQDDRLWEELSSGPTPQRHWLNVMTLVENIRAYLRSGAEDGQGTSPWTQVVIAYKEALETSKEGKEELTLRELWTYDLALQVFSIAGCGAVGEDSPGVADESGDPSENILKLLNTWIDTTDASKPFGAADMAIGTHWSRLHTYFTAYEAASLVLTLLHWLEMRGKASSAAGPKAGGGKSQEKKKAKAGKTADASADDGANRAVFPPPEIMAQLRTAANELIEKVKAEARQAKQALSEGGVLCKLVDVIMGNADGEAAPPADDAQSQNEVFETAYAAFIESAGGEVAVEVVVGKWLASWEDALDGVLAVDVHRVVGVGGGGGGEEKGSSGIGAALGGLSGLVLRGKKGKKR